MYACLDLIRKIIKWVNSSLKHQFFIYFFMLSVIPIIIMGYVSYSLTKNIMVDKAMKMATNYMAKQVNSFDLSGKHTELLLSDTTSSLDTIQYLKVAGGSDAKAYESYIYINRIAAKFDSIMNQRNDMIKFIGIMPENDFYPFTRGLADIKYLTEYRQMDFFRKAVESPNNVIWRLDYNSAEKKYYISISQSVDEALSGRNLGVVVVYLYMDFVSEILFNPHLEPDEIIFMLDRQNNFVYHNDKSRIGSRLEDGQFLDIIGKNKEGCLISSIGLEKYIITYSTSDINGWKIVDMKPYKNINREIASMPNFAILITFFCVAYAIIIAIRVYSGVYKPIGKLTRAISNLGEGNLKIRIDSKRLDELGVLSDKFDEMTERMEMLIEYNKQEQAKKKEIEIKMLQAQITPHFLYNTLNAIKVLARKNRSNDVIEMVVALVKLLQTSVSSSSDMIRIEDEIDYVKNYIKIMEYRYNKKLTVDYLVDEIFEGYGILKFTIQPLVENCFIHAFKNKLNDCRIVVKVYENGDDIEFEVIDNGIGMDSSIIQNILQEERKTSDLKFNKIGVYNINERLKLNFGEQYGIRFESKAGKGTSVYVLLPKIKHVDKIV